MCTVIIHPKVSVMPQVTRTLLALFCLTLPRLVALIFKIGPTAVSCLFNQYSLFFTIGCQITNKRCAWDLKERFD